MKKILCTAVSALALVSFADGVNSTEFGVLYVPSTANETVVAVPWLESGTGTENVSVSNLVLTAGLTTGDTLYLYSNGSASYSASWSFNGTRWTPGQEGVYTLPRGNALLLKRGGTPTKGFYIMGKPAVLSPGEEGVTMAVGSSTAAAYTLVAPPKTTGTTLGALSFSNCTNFKDYIIMEDSDGKLVMYNYKDGWVTSKGASASSVAVPQGQGFWFMSRSGKAASVSWGD